MKTFEERYTAWIDGELNGSALSAFEQELSRRAEAGDAEADKSEALELRALLKEHLQAPDLTNTEFFNHQMRERIDAEYAQVVRKREAARPRWQLPTFAWPILRMAGAGALFLFVAGALYYALMPAHVGDNSNVAAAPTVQPNAAAVATTDSSPAPANGADRPNGTQFVKLDTPTPAPLALDDDLRAQVAPPAVANGTSATAIRLDNPNVNVLWVNGLNYLPAINTPATGSPVPTDVPATSPSPAAVNP